MVYAVVRELYCHLHEEIWVELGRLVRVRVRVGVRLRVRVRVRVRVSGQGQG